MRPRCHGGIPAPSWPWHCLNPNPWQRGLTGSVLRGAGVGFSYCDYDNCTASDTSTAIDNHGVLKAFFKGFPEFAKNDFYITGESYAGVYCPTLAEQIMNDPDNKINLKGLAVGNGCWGSKVGLCAFGADMDRINTCVSSISPSESASSSGARLGMPVAKRERLS